MPAGMRRKSIIDGEWCWKKWTLEMGSLGKIQKHMEDNNMINPETNRVPTKSGIEKAAYAWALTHQAEARKDLEYAWQAVGEVLTEEKWNDFLVRAAKLVYHQRPARFNRFVARHGLQQYT